MKHSMYLMPHHSLLFLVFKNSWNQKNQKKADIFKYLMEVWYYKKTVLKKELWDDVESDFGGKNISQTVA